MHDWVCYFYPQEKKVSEFHSDSGWNCLTHTPLCSINMASGPVPEEQSVTCFPFTETFFFSSFCDERFLPFLRRLESLILNWAEVINDLYVKEATEISLVLYFLTLELEQVTSHKVLQCSELQIIVLCKATAAVKQKLLSLILTKLATSSGVNNLMCLLHFSLSFSFFNSTWWAIWSRAWKQVA